MKEPLLIYQLTHFHLLQANSVTFPPSYLGRQSPHVDLFSRSWPRALEENVKTEA